MAEPFGFCSVEKFANDVAEAVADSSVSRVVIACDSAGGDVSGIIEAWGKLRRLGGTKPIDLAVSSMCASAALWLGSACRSISVTPGGLIGGLGVMTLHEDFSEALRMAGVKVTPIVSTGSPYKLETNPWEPLSPTGEAQLQKLVDEFYGKFVENVATGRGVKQAKVRSDYGQGRVMGAQEAVAVGLADRVATWEQVATDDEDSGPSWDSPTGRHSSVVVEEQRPLVAEGSPLEWREALRQGARHRQAAAEAERQERDRPCGVGPWEFSQSLRRRQN
jgi:signal peptide peptidase SppA